MSFGLADKPIQSGAMAPESLADLSRPAARIFARLAAISLGAILPILMVVANKSAPATFVAAAVFANAAALFGGAAPALKQRYLALMRRPVTLAVVLAVGLCVLSFAWTVDASFTRRGLVEDLPELLAAFGTAAAWPLVSRRGDETWLAIGLIGAAVLIIVARETGMPLHALVHARGEAWDLKRSAIPPVLLVWPALALWFGPGPRLLLAALVLGTAVAGIAFSHSGAPAFGLVAGLAAYGLARLAPKPAIGLVGLVLIALIAAGPFTGTLASRLLPAAAQNALRDEHASHRILIWTAFETRLRDRPLLGHGFDTSFRVSLAPRPGGLAPADDNGEMVDNHPHNVILQFWVEVGLAGALAAAALGAFVFGRLWTQTAREVAPRLGLFVCVLGIGLVGLSAWQPWWIASIAVALMWFGFAARTGSAAPIRDAAG